MSTQRPQSRQRFWLGALAILVGASIGWSCLHQGWFPHDEGQLGQSAERVLNGELPHRDFDEMYTGLLSYLHAGSFWLFGTRSESMRYVLWLAWIPFLVVSYRLALEVTNPVGASVVTLLASVWSIPVYAAPLPSWYNLFFAVWCAGALNEWRKSGKPWWLVVAGLLIGISLLFKISGLFLLAASLLFLLYNDQLKFNIQNRESFSEGGPGTNDIRRPNLRSSLVFGGLVLAGLLSTAFVNQHNPLMQILHFVIPFVAIILFLLRQEWESTCGQRSSLAGVSGNIAWLISGFAMPVAGWFAFYAFQGALGELSHGLFVMPKKRLEFAADSFPSVWSLRYVIPMLLLLYPALTRIPATFMKSGFVVAMTIGFGCVAGLSMYREPGFKLAFYSIRNLGPFLILGNLWLLVQFGSRMSAGKRELAFLLTVIPFFVSLIQFPFSSPIYFFYAAPAFLLAAATGCWVQKTAASGKDRGEDAVPGKALVSLAVVMVLLASVRFHSSQPGINLVPEYLPREMAQVQSARCRLTIDRGTADCYNRLLSLVAEHSSPGDKIYAGPDAPEIAFLADRRPTDGVMYEFFHGPLTLNEKVSEDVRLVVLHLNPAFSQVPASEELERLEEDFELVETVRFKDPYEEAKDRFMVFVRRSEKVSQP